MGQMPDRPRQLPQSHKRQHMTQNTDRDTLAHTIARAMPKRQPLFPMDAAKAAGQGHQPRSFVNAAMRYLLEIGIVTRKRRGKQAALYMRVKDLPEKRCRDDVIQYTPRHTALHDYDGRPMTVSLPKPPAFLLEDMKQ